MARQMACKFLTSNILAVHSVAERVAHHIEDTDVLSLIEDLTFAILHAF
jgi:hypothetical protein